MDPFSRGAITFRHHMKGSRRSMMKSELFGDSDRKINKMQQNKKKKCGKKNS